MWPKVLAGAVLIILIIAAALIFSRPNGGEKTAEQPMEADRIAKNITLYELNTEDGKSTTLHADKALLKEDEVLDLFDITLKEEDKFIVTGPHARYDLEKSKLDVNGDILLTAKDGSRAFFKDLTWEKSTHLLHTDNPVRLENKGGWMTGRRMEMTDDLSRISFSGGVHGQVDRNFDIGG